MSGKELPLAGAQVRKQGTEAGGFSQAGSQGVLRPLVEESPTTDLLGA